MQKIGVIGSLKLTTTYHFERLFMVNDLPDAKSCICGKPFADEQDKRWLVVGGLHKIGLGPRCSNCIIEALTQADEYRLYHDGRYNYDDKRTG